MGGIYQEEMADEARKARTQVNGKSYDHGNEQFHSISLYGINRLIIKERQKASYSLSSATLYSISGVMTLLDPPSISTSLIVCALFTRISTKLSGL